MALTTPTERLFLTSWVAELVGQAGVKHILPDCRVGTRPNSSVWVGVAAAGSLESGLEFHLV